VSSQERTESKAESKEKSPFSYNVALRRLVYVAIVGCLFVVTYGSRYGHEGAASFLSIVSVGLMTGGAALLSGGLLGFLFGVPHTRGVDKGQGKDTGSKNDDEQDGNERPPAAKYRPNTSLEEISDWLTKILVGVGLVQIKILPGKLLDLAAYIAKGLGGGDQAQAFALTVLVYFSVCGFVFGFLWARLYLPRWFQEADTIQDLEDKISRLEKRQYADARALAVVDQLINRQADDVAPSEEATEKAIKAASKSVRVQVFGRAEKAAATSRDAEDFQMKVQGAISIFRGLIKGDDENQYHRNHSELSYALRRKKPPDLPEAEKEITKAIDIRNRLGKRGWRHYEFHRARCRIEQVPDYDKKTGAPAFVQEVLNDLRLAYSDGEKWPRWHTPDSSVARWMVANKIDEAALKQP